MTPTYFAISRCTLLGLCMLLTGALSAQKKSSYQIKTKQGKYAIVNDKGKLLLPPLYDYISPFYEGYAIACRWQEKENVLVDSLGNIVKKLAYASNEIITVDGKAYHVISQAGKKGLMNMKGDVLIAPNTYTYLQPLVGTHLLWAVQNNMRGLILPNGQVVVMPENSLQHVNYWYDGPIITREQTLEKKVIEVFDTTGKNIPYTFSINDINSNTALMARLREHQLIPPSIRETSISTNPIYDYNRDVSRELTFLEKPKNVVFPFLNTNNCDNGWILVWNTYGDKRYNIDKNKYVFYRPDGTLAIQETFEKARPFINGYAPVMKKGKWGYIDTTGNWVIPPQYQVAWQFNNGRALVGIMQSNKKIQYGFINTQGTLVIPAIFTNIYQMNYGFRNGRFMGYVTPRTTLTQEEIHTIDTTGTVIAKSAYRNDDTRRIQVDYFNTAYDNMMKEHKRNYKEAVRLLEEAALFGERKAYVNLGYIYSMGGYGVEKDIQKAIAYYQKVDNEHAASNLGGIYLRGDVTPDYSLAAQYLTQGAYLGSITSMEQLARMYGRGKYLPKDSLTGAFWIDRLFEKDSTSALSTLSFIKTGRETWQEYADAMSDMFRINNEAMRNITAAMQKYNQAMDSKLLELENTNLENAKTLLSTKNYEPAIRLLSMLTQSLHPEALYLMGGLYEKGEGVTKDLEKAKELYTLALSKGYEQARLALEQLSKK